MWRAALFALIPILSLGCNSGPEFPVPEPSTTRLPEKGDKGNYDRVNDLAFSLSRETGLGESGNDLISPLSVAHNLSMLMNGSSGKARNELLHLFGLTEDTIYEYNESQRALLNSLRASDGRPLKTANSLWAVWPMVMDKAFASEMGARYEAVVKKLGGSGVEAVRLVNEWVKERTDGQIERVVDRLDPKTVLIVISAASFDGDWESPFDPKDTHEAVFHAPNGSVSVAMMHQEGVFKYADKDTFQALELPYRDDDSSMVLILPKEGTLISDVLESFDANTWATLAGEMKGVEVSVSVPKFEYVRDYDLIPTVRALGVPSLFDSNCNLRPVSVELERGYSVTRMIHRAKISVDERGTKAAGVTLSEVTSVGTPFIADRPFLFAIVEKKTGTIAFLGALVNPAGAQ